ncbi:Heat shock 70 kDa protein 12A [Mactra antiquata]
MSSSGEKDKHYLIVAAIDFGTAYSGYAFSTRDDFVKDPLKIGVNTWSGGTLMSTKAPTCVLFTKKRQFVAFGYEAEDKYMALAGNKEHKDYYFFRRFKMRLFNQIQLKRKFMLEDEMCEKLPAMEVFSACIKYLRDRLLNRIHDSYVNMADEEIKWVLTVPAIWNDTSKQFMREAAEKAGINTSQLLIALEPEAASLCCRHLPMDTMKGCSGGLKPFAPKAKYMVFDAGGGTIDITVHQVQADGSIKELYVANGGNWGGTSIDRKYHEFLGDIVGNNLIDDFQVTEMEDYIELFREFEVKKRTFKKNMTETITIKVPAALGDAFSRQHKGKTLEAHIKTKPKYKDHVRWSGDKLRIEPVIAKNLFKDACDNIESHLKSLFEEDLVKDVSTILMVGGFSESAMLQSMLKEQFPKKKIIIPTDPGLAVLKGAVIFGHDPSVIKERKCRFTYGVETSFPFQEGKHPISKRIEASDGKLYCSGMFSKHVEIGQPLTVGGSQVEKSYQPTKDDQDAIKFLVYASSDKDPVFTSDKKCNLLGSLTIELEGSGRDRSATVQMTFGDTELHVTAKDTKSGKVTKAKFDFLG